MSARSKFIPCGHLVAAVGLHREGIGMTEDVYRELCKTMEKRGGMYPGMDIPEFYEVAHELFTPEEAAVTNAMPQGFNTACVIAREMGRDEREVAPVLEEMAKKGLCMSNRVESEMVYTRIPFVPGIFEYQFMRGTFTDRDKRLARLIQQYKQAVYSRRGPLRETFPTLRVITVDRKIRAGNIIHTYDQVASYIETHEPLALSTCYCRHQARLMAEGGDYCGRPVDVCVQFGHNAQFVIDRGIGREISKEEAMEVLKRSEEAGLVHCSNNLQKVDFLCNCCPCHCVILKNALAHPKPGLAVKSGFQPVWDQHLCTGCSICIERCPMKALTQGDDLVPRIERDRCIGCGVCATGCPEEAIALEERPDARIPPIDREALREAIKGSRQ